MKTLVLLFVCGFNLTMQAQSVTRLRKEFVAASDAAVSAEKFLRTTEAISSSEKPLMQAYKGAALVIWGKYARGIEEKKRVARQGITLLESAVANDPDHIEIRTLRLSIQENSPKILKYKGKIEEDRSFVNQKFQELPEGELKSFIAGYLKRTEN